MEFEQLAEAETVCAALYQCWNLRNEGNSQETCCHYSCCCEINGWILFYI